jgi:hypothetical protein
VCGGEPQGVTRAVGVVEAGDHRSLEAGRAGRDDQQRELEVMHEAGCRRAEHEAVEPALAARAADQDVGCAPAGFVAQRSPHAERGKDDRGRC